MFHLEWIVCLTLAVNIRLLWDRNGLVIAEFYTLSSHKLTKLFNDPDFSWAITLQYAGMGMRISEPAVNMLLGLHKRKKHQSRWLEPWTVWSNKRCPESQEDPGSSCGSRRQTGILCGLQGVDWIVWSLCSTGSTVWGTSDQLQSSFARGLQVA